MSNIKLLLDVIGDIRSLADSLQSLTEEMKENEKTENSAPKTKVKTNTSNQKDVKLEDVRAILADKSRLGKTAQVKALITTFGADKLSDVDPSNYAELMKKAEVL